MKYPIILLAIIALLSASCESLVTDVELPDIEKRIVINAFLSPDDDSIRVILTESQPVFGSSVPDWEIPFIDDADVFISTGSTTKQLDFHPGNYTYTLSVSEVPLIEGHSYTVKAKTPDGREASGRCTLPEDGGQVVTLEEIKQVQTEWGQQYTIGVRFTDPAGEGDHYRILMRSIWESNLQPGDTLTGYPYMESRSEFLDDVNFDGGSQLITFTDDIRQGFTLKKVEVFLYLTDETYYLFHRSIESNQSSEGNPFVEPALVYSNVDGGLGVVAGYLLKKVVLAVP